MTWFSKFAAHFLPAQSVQPFAAVSGSAFAFSGHTNNQVSASYAAGELPLLMGQARPAVMQHTAVLAQHLRAECHEFISYHADPTLFRKSAQEIVDAPDNKIIWTTQQPSRTHRQALLSVGFALAAEIVRRDREIFPTQSSVLLKLQHEVISEKAGRYRGQAGRWHRDGLRDGAGGRYLPKEQQPRLWAWRDTMGLQAAPNQQTVAVSDADLAGNWRPQQVLTYPDGSLLLLNCGAHGSVHASRPFQPTMRPTPSLMLLAEIYP